MNPPITAVKDGAPATQEGGENPTKTFDEQALDIINSIGGDNNAETKTKVEDKQKDPEKTDDSEKKKDDEAKKQDEENKIPLARLQKVIQQRDEARENIISLNDEINSLKTKLDEEQKRIDSLSDEEKEEQRTYKKLGIETKEDKLKDKIESLEKKVADYEKKIQSYESEENQVKVSKLSARIEELSKEYDGNNGLPKFDIEELIKFGREENYMPEDPIKLYNLKYQNEIMARKYKAEKSNGEADKGNREQFAPINKKFSFDDDEFDKEALNIINSIT